MFYHLEVIANGINYLRKNDYMDEDTYSDTLLKIGDELREEYGGKENWEAFKDFIDKEE